MRGMSSGPILLLVALIALLVLTGVWVVWAWNATARAREFYRACP